MNFFRRIEDVLVQIVRVVLLAFSTFVLVILALWLVDHFKAKKAEPVAVEAVALDWKDAKVDLKFVEEETGRDLGNVASQTVLEKRLIDPDLRPSFQKADGLIRGFVYKDPAKRKSVEDENGSRGLAPINPLLKGDAIPSSEDVKRQIQLREAREAASCCGVDSGPDATDAAADATAEPVSARRVSMTEVRAARAARDTTSAEDAVAAAVAEAAGASADSWMSSPVYLEEQINERAQMAEIEHGPGSYAAYVKGLPAALEKVFGNPALASKMQKQSAEQMLNMVLINYTLSFDRTAQVLKGEDPDDNKWELASLDTAFWTMLITCLVMVIMALVLIRMERHLRVISEKASGDKS